MAAVAGAARLSKSVNVRHQVHPMSPSSQYNNLLTQRPRPSHRGWSRLADLASTKSHNIYNHATIMLPSGPLPPLPTRNYTCFFLPSFFKTQLACNGDATSDTEVTTTCNQVHRGSYRAPCQNLSAKCSLIPRQSQLASNVPNFLSIIHLSLLVLQVKVCLRSKWGAANSAAQTNIVPGNSIKRHFPRRKKRW